MRIVDVNTAIGAPMKSPRFQDEAGLVRWLNDYRIDQAVTYHSEFLRSPWFGNGEMVKAAGRAEGRIKLCLGVNPSLMEESLPGRGTLVERLCALRPSAVRVFPTNNDYLFDAFYAQDMLAAFDVLRMPVIVDAQYDQVFFSGLPATARAYPNVRFIILRWGLNYARYINPLLKHLTNVYFEIGKMVDVYQIEEIVQNFGSERLLFGSGLPEFEPSGPLALLTYAQIPEPDRENIAHANFERLEAEIRYDA